MVRNMKWIGIGALTAVLMGAVVVAGCDKQNSSNPDNIPGNIPSAPTPTVSTTTATPPLNTETGTSASSMASRGSFDDAAKTWSQVEETRTKLDTAMKAQQLDQVHEDTSKINALVKTLPAESSALPEDKRKTLDEHVKNVGDLAGMMDKSNDPNDMTSVQEHHTAMNDALDMMKEDYPAEVMRSAMHMSHMHSSGQMISDDDKPGKGMSGMGSGGGTGGVGGAASGMGSKMGGGMHGMGGKMSGMGGGGASGMIRTQAPAAPDKPAAADKMGGMGKPADPGKMSGDM